MLIDDTIIVGELDPHQMDALSTYFVKSSHI